MLCRAGTATTVSELQLMVKTLGRAAKNRQAEMQDDCRRFADTIISGWATSCDSQAGNTMLEVVRSLGDQSLACDFIGRLVVRNEKIDKIQSLRLLCRESGWDVVRSGLEAIIAGTTRATLNRNAALLRDICSLRDKDTKRHRTCGIMVAQIVPALQRVYEGSPDRYRHSGAPDLVPVLASLFHSLLLWGDDACQTAFVDLVTNSSQTFDIRTHQVPALVSLRKQLTAFSGAVPPAVAHWLQHCIAVLEQATASEPQPFANWTRDPIASCECRDCSALSDFLRDPNVETAEFPLAKNRRQHLHQQIQRDNCDTTHTTRHRGSPHQLVCSKTNTSFRQRHKTWKSDQKLLAALRPLIELLNRS